MTELPYKTARALEMAIKEAAKQSGKDVNKAIGDFYQGRLIERVFSEPTPSFVLKGGRGMLARYVDARRSRDSDFLYTGNSLDEAVEEFKRIAAIDLGDYLVFRLSWYTTLSQQYTKVAKEARLPDEFCNVEPAETLVKSCVDPALAEMVPCKTWNPDLLAWE